MPRPNMKNLSRAQAIAVRDVLNALHKVGGSVETIKLPERISVDMYLYDGGIGVTQGGRTTEEYDDLNAFLQAYGVKDRSVGPKRAVKNLTK